MEIQTPKQLDIVDIGGEFQSKKAGIDESSMPFLFEMMSKNLYSDPIGSIVREITSNCFDSHKEAMVDDPVIVSIGEDEEGDYITFKDFGVGLSPERIDKVYMNYFSSTKRGTNEQIGGFGLGSKTPLSYNDYFYITTNFDGKQYQYLYSKGEAVPTLDLLTEEETTERNGTEIKIYIKSWSDRNKFIDACQKQLSYFDNVYFKNIDLDNDYFIFEKELYKFRTKDKYSDYMHIVNGKVAYPIDWDKIGIDPVKIPIGVKFQIGELLVTPNREALRYTDEIIELVKERVEATVEALKQEFLDSNEPYTDLVEWMDADKTRPHLKFHNEDLEFRLYLTGLGLEAKVEFKPFKDLGVEFDRDFNFFAYYNVNNYFNHGFSYSGKKIIDCLLDGDTLMFTKKKLDLKEDEIKIDYVNQYLLDNNYGKVYLVKQDRFSYKTIASKLKLDLTYYTKFGNGITVFPLGKAKKIYALIKVVKDYINSRVLDFTYEDIIVPEEFKKEFKRKRLESTAAYQRKLNSKFIVKDVRHGHDTERTAAYYDNFNSNLVIYGGRKDKKQLDIALALLNSKKSKNFVKNIHYKNNYYQAYDVIMIAEANFKYLKNYKNMIHVKELYSDNRIFRQFATSFKIETLFKDLVKVQRVDVEELIKQIKNICCPIGELMQECLEYRDKHKLELVNYASNYKVEDVKNEILDIAQKHNYFDPLVDYKIVKLEQWFKDVELLRFTQINEQSLPYILKYLKDKKKKLNLEYYSQVIHKEEARIGQLVFNFDEEQLEKVTFKIAS